LEKEERENLTVDIHAEENRRKAIIESEEFHLLRKLPTRREFANSKKKWYKGIHYPYNVDKGFPIVIQKKRDDLQDAKHYEKPYQAPVYNSDLILNGYYDQEKRYGNFMAETNYKKAEKYIQRNYYEEEKKKRKQEKLLEQQKLTRKRKGVMGVDITLDVTRAKYMATKEKLAFTVKLGEDNKDSRYNRSGVSNKDKRKKNIINFELEKIVADVRRGPKKKDIYRHEAMDSDEEELLNEEKRLTRQKLAKGGGGGGEEEEGERRKMEKKKKKMRASLTKRAKNRKTMETETMKEGKEWETMMEWTRRLMWSWILRNDLLLCYFPLFSLPSHLSSVRLLRLSFLNQQQILRRLLHRKRRANRHRYSLLLLLRLRRN
jgi:hypothetical protein